MANVLLELKSHSDHSFSIHRIAPVKTTTSSFEPIDGRVFLEWATCSIFLTLAGI